MIIVQNRSCADTQKQDHVARVLPNDIRSYQEKKRFERFRFQLFVKTYPLRLHEKLPLRILYIEFPLCL